VWYVLDYLFNVVQRLTTHVSMLKQQHVLFHNLVDLAQRDSIAEGTILQRDAAGYVIVLHEMSHKSSYISNIGFEGTNIRLA
jgi:hypothetical protein